MDANLGEKVGGRPDLSVSDEAWCVALQAGGIVADHPSSCRTLQMVNMDPSLV